MSPFTGIIVQIISNGQPLKLYDDPDAADLEIDYTRHHYVEAITGANFSVKIMLTTEFKLHGLRPQDGVRIDINLDGQERYQWYHLTREKIEEDLLEGKPGGCRFNGSSHFCPRAGEWMESSYTFGRLDISKLIVLQSNAESSNFW